MRCFSTPGAPPLPTAASTLNCLLLNREKSQKMESLLSSYRLVVGSCVKISAGKGNFQDTRESYVKHLESGE